jgi:hypothetical protein
MTNHQKTISISPEFFKRERNNYSDIAFSFWRELFQNSIDAGSKNITVDLNDGLVHFNDDGEGMTRDILDDVYFSLGSSSKNDSSSVGGFGKARIITCFSNHSYQISSFDYIAEGSGANYTVKNSDEKIKGCRVKIDVDTSGQYEEIDLSRGLNSFLSMSQLRCNVINMNDHSTYNEWLHKRGKTKRLSFGTVYANKNGYFRNRLIVRVNGVAMFTRYINADYQVIVEVDSYNSREILLSNRDSLKSKYQNEVDTFVQMLAVNSRVLKDNTTKVSIVGDGCFIQDYVPEKDVNNNDYENAEEDYPPIGSTAAALKSAGKDRVGFDDDNSYSPSERQEVDDSHYDQVDEDIASMLLYCDSYDKILKQCYFRYNPKNWKNGQGRDIKNLLRIWIIACQYSLKAMQEIAGMNSSINWRPGFLFSDDTDAMFFRSKGGISHFLLKPINDDGKKAFSINSKADRAEIISKAIHEVTHFSFPDHNENYACLQTLLNGKVFGQMKEINKEIKRQMTR